MLRVTAIFLVFLSALALIGCGGAASPAIALQPPPSSSTSTPYSGIYVYSIALPQAVVSFAVTNAASPTASSILFSSDVQPGDDFIGTAADSSGNIYVSTSPNSFPHLPRVLVLSPPPSGTATVTPSRIIAGSNTQLNFDTYAGGGPIASDGAGNVYVAQAPIVEFASDANGNAAPIRTFPVQLGTVPLPSTGLVWPISLAVDNDGYLYVLNIDNKRQSRIEVFAPGQNGDVAPVRTIFGPST